jgi:hypothetical protein
MASLEMTTMKSLLAALLSTCFAVPALAADDCSAPSSRTVPMLAALPAEVQGLLGRNERGIGGIADVGEAFNATDAVRDMAPMRRFRSASMGEDCYAVTIERGGFGHWFETTVVRKREGAWRVAGTRVPAPSEVSTAAEKVIVR